MTLRTPAFNDAKTYGFEWLRASNELPLQEGVLNQGGAGTDLKATAAAGGGLRVDIAAGVGLVKGDSGIAGTGLSQGLYMVVNDAAVANAVTLAAADVTNPRIDQIIMRVRDSSDLGSASDDAIFDFLTGTPTSGATLDNRNGAAALPNDAIRIADVLVPAAAVNVIAANVRDRRAWARGAYRRILRAISDYSTAATTLGVVDSTNLAPRLEIGAAANIVEVSLNGEGSVGVAGQMLPLSFRVDALAGQREYLANQTEWGPRMPGTGNGGFTLLDTLTMAAGSHTIAPYFMSWTGTNVLRASAGKPLVYIIREVITQNADNT